MIPLHDDNPTEIKPYVTVGLIAACVLVYLWQLSLGEGQVGAIYALGVIPAVLFDTFDTFNVMFSVDSAPVIRPRFR